MTMEIDFVIPWVDGADMAWQAEKALYQPAEETENAAEVILRPGYAAVEAKEKTAAFDLVRCGIEQLADRYPEFVQVK